MDWRITQSTTEPMTSQFNITFPNKILLISHHESVDPVASGLTPVTRGSFRLSRVYNDVMHCYTSCLTDVIR